MTSTATYRRFLTALSLVLTPVLTIVWIVLMPSMDFDKPASMLAAIAGSGTPAILSSLGFTYSQLPFIVAILGTAQLLSSRAPVLSNLVATFGILGGFGHAVVCGMNLVTLAMAADAEHHDAYAQLLGRDVSFVDGPFMILGTAGTVLAIVLLGIGLLRAKAAPVWVSIVLFAFVVIEFVGSNFTVWAGHVSGALFLTGLFALAVIVWRSPLEVWRSGGSSAREPEPSSVQG